MDCKLTSMLPDFNLNTPKVPQQNRYNSPKGRCLDNIKNTRKQDFYPCLEESCNITDLSATNELLPCVLLTEKICSCGRRLCEEMGATYA